MNEGAIGVFDSGLGGLTTVKELCKILPNEDIIYFGDTSRVPYGTRSNDTIKKYAIQDINFLLSKDVKLIIAACNTASSILTKKTVEGLKIPFTGVVVPAIEAAYTATKNGKIGVIGTQATINSGAYENALGGIDKSLEIYSNACPMFVPLVENGYIDRECIVTNIIAKEYLMPLLNKGIDTLILGCTHYPILKDIIADICKGVTLIDSGQQAAKTAKMLLTSNNLLSSTGGNYSFYVSDSALGFQESASKILTLPINGEVTQIDIEMMSSDLKMQI